MTKNILLSVLMAATLSHSLTARPKATKVNAATEQPLYTESDLEAVAEEARNQGLQEGLEVGVDMTDALDDDDKQFNGQEVATNAMDMKEMLENPDAMAEVMNDPEFKTFLAQLEKNPKLAQALIQNEDAMDTEEDEENMNKKED